MGGDKDMYQCHARQDNNGGGTINGNKSRISNNKLFICNGAMEVEKLIQFSLSIIVSSYCSNQNNKFVLTQFTFEDDDGSFASVITWDHFAN